MRRKAETALPDETDPTLAANWLTDRIVSIDTGSSSDFWRDRRGLLRPDRRIPYLRLHFIAIFVSDQELSKQFFVEKLGFSLVSDARFASGNRWVEVAPPDGTAVLALVLPTQGHVDIAGRSNMVTFLTEDVETTYQEWSARGVKFTIPPQTPAWGGMFCRFEDPDGNSFALAGFDDVTRAIENRRREQAEKLEAERRAAQEIEIAKKVQARLFPQRRPAIPGLDYGGICIPARAVGGDYYDFLDLGLKHLALVVGDIAGKGIAGALLMANLQANLRSQSAMATEQPHQFLASVNRLLFENTEPNAYATLFYSEYCATSGRLLWANCGHQPGLLLRADDSLERLDATCTVVGLFEDWQCSISETQIRDGDVLVLYTDGVIEAFDEADEEFGEERLIDVLKRERHLPACELARTIAAEVEAFSAREQFDDITLIAAKRSG